MHDSAKLSEKILISPVFRVDKDAGAEQPRGAGGAGREELESQPMTLSKTQGASIKRGRELLDLRANLNQKVHCDCQEPRALLEQTQASGVWAQVYNKNT